MDSSLESIYPASSDYDFDGQSVSLDSSEEEEPQALQCSRSPPHPPLRRSLLLVGLGFSDITRIHYHLCRWVNKLLLSYLKGKHRIEVKLVLNISGKN
jgi:hypothetical protein